MNDQMLKLKSMQDIPVAGQNLKERSTGYLIELAAAKKRKMDFAKAEMDAVSAEIQSRAIAFQEDRHIKFTEWQGEGRAMASVTVAQSFDILNYFRLKELLGKELVEDKIKIKPQDIKYDIEANFKRALTALVLDDYNRDMTIEDVVDKAGWCQDDAKRKASLLKKLKGDYHKDKQAVLAVLNMQDDEIDIDVELYYIYQIRNWQLIRAYFDEDRIKEIADVVKRCIMVDETAKIGLKVGKEVAV